MAKKAVKFKIIKENKVGQGELLQEYIRLISGLGRGSGARPLIGAVTMKGLRAMAAATDNLVAAAARTVDDVADAAEKLAKASLSLHKAADGGQSTYAKMLLDVLDSAPKKVGPSPSKLQQSTALQAARNLGDLRRGVQKTIDKISEIEANVRNQRPILAAQLREAGLRSQKALEETEETIVKLVAQIDGITPAAAKAKIAETAKKLADAKAIVPAEGALSKVDDIIDVLPAPRDLAVLKPAQQKEFLVVTAKIINSEKKALPAPVGPVRPDYIPPEIFRLPEKSKGLEKLVRYATAAGITGGIIALLRKSDPEGALGADDEGVDGGDSGQSPLGFTYDCPKFNRFVVASTGQNNLKLATKSVQELLVNLGYSVKKGIESPFGADGQGTVDALEFKKYGINGECNKDTQDAVAKFQADHGLPTDGIVAPNTWKALMQKARGEEVNIDTGAGPEKPEKVLTNNEKNSAEGTINQILSRMRKAKKIQNIINAYVMFRQRLILKLRKIAGGGDMGQFDPNTRKELSKTVSKTFPRLPQELDTAAGSTIAAQQYVFASKKFRQLPDKIMVGQAIFAKVSEDLTAEVILKLAIKSLLEEEKIDYGAPKGVAKDKSGILHTRDKFGVRNPRSPSNIKKQEPELPPVDQAAAATKESKSYDIDFSRWKPMIKNSY